MPPSVTAQPGVSLHSWSQPRVGKVEFEPSTKCSARRANELNFPHARGCVSPAQSSFPGHYSPGTALPRNSPPEPQINQHIFSLQLQPHISSPLLPTALLPKPLDVGIPGPLPAPWRALQIPLGMLRSHSTAGSCWRGCMEHTPKLHQERATTTPSSEGNSRSLPGQCRHI